MDNKCTTSDKSLKKLVQARLPFKVLSSIEKNKVISNSTEKLNSKDLNSTELEANANLIESDYDKNVKCDTLEAINLSDEDDVDKSEHNISTFNKQNKTPDNKPTKVFIKLPISSKKKKRKCSAINEQSTDQPEIINVDKNEEEQSEDKANANKKIKISDFVVKQKFEDGTSIINDYSPRSMRSNSKKIETTCDKILISDNCFKEAEETENEDKTTDTNKLTSELQKQTISEEESSKELDINQKIEINKEEETLINGKESKEVDIDRKFEKKEVVGTSINLNSKSSEKVEESKEVAIDEKLGSNKEEGTGIKIKDTSTEEDDKNMSVIEDQEKMVIDDSSNELNSSALELTEDLDVTTELNISTSFLSNENSKSRTRKRTNLDKTNEGNAKIQVISKSKNDSKTGSQKNDKEEQKRKEREVKEQKRIQEKLDREEKRKKEKEEKEKKRLAEIESRNEEKRKKEEIKEEEKRKKEELKEEDRRKKEEEKRKKDELREDERRKKEEERRKKELEKEEIENKKKKAAEVFTKFFVQSRKGSEEENLYSGKLDAAFMPFQIKEDMRLAPIVRRQLDSEKKNILEEFLKSNETLSVSDLYLCKLKCNYKPLKTDRTILKLDYDEVIIVDEMHGTSQCIDENSKVSKKYYKAKYFLFRENRRPPYYGTWRKKSSTINPRKPFETDKTVFDYEIDSDLEWEDEEPGESLNGSEDEKESEDDYEVDNEFFVPHGHLSDEELAEEDHSPEVQKAKLKILQQEFASEMKKKTEKLKPRLIGVVWSNKDASKPESCPDIVWQFLKQKEMFFNGRVTIAPPNENKISTELYNSPKLQEKPKLNKRVELPEEHIKPLIKLVHGNTNNKSFMIKEFQAYLTAQQHNEDTEKVHYTKSCIRGKIQSIAQWKILKSKTLKKKYLCWVVSKEILEKYDLTDLDIRNKWTYILSPKKKNENLKNEEQKTSLSKQQSIKLNENSPVITKFTKVLTREEKLTLLEKNKEDPIKSSSTSNENSTKEINTIKKRVPILFSVPRGQNVPEVSKNIAVNDFLKQKSKILSSPDKTATKTISAPINDDCIVID